MKDAMVLSCLALLLVGAQCEVGQAWILSSRIASTTKEVQTVIEHDLIAVRRHTFSMNNVV